MAKEKRLIDANAVDYENIACSFEQLKWLNRIIEKQPIVDAIPVAEIEAYLQSKLDEWNALGDRKFEPANVWGYNFIMACFDDLERRGAYEKVD